jgi:hypothetical protein
VLVDLLTVYGYAYSMTSLKRLVTRREFLKMAGLGLSAMAVNPIIPRWNNNLTEHSVLAPEFPQAELLARNCTTDTSLQWGGTIPIMSRPDVNSTKVRNAHADEVFAWQQEVSAETIDLNYPNQRWVETPEGYLRSYQLQPCKNIPNIPFSTLPDGKAGFWAEVTVPYVDLGIERSASSVGWVSDHVAFGLTPRLYYSQVMWIDQVRTGDMGLIQYRVNERYGNPGDLFWADGAAFRPLSNDDVAPIHPDVDPETKKVIVNLSYQTLTCKEADKEVYFCRVSTGALAGSTPIGEHPIWRKLLSVRMAANNVGASYDLPGISWTTFFVGDGVAIHGATSHNNFGMVQSHGCVNCKPEDAKWIFKWTQPLVGLEPGDLLWKDWTKGSTHVIVEDTI